MCSPTLAYAGMAIGSAAMSYQQEKVAAETQTKLYKLNETNARTALTDSYSQMQTRMGQQNEATSQQIQQRRVEAMRQASTARAANADSGVTGVSVDSILRDISAVASGDVMTMEQNRDWSLSQMGNEMRGMRTQAKNQINSMTPGVKPSPWSAVFKIGGAAMDTYQFKKQYDS